MSGSHQQLESYIQEAKSHGFSVTKIIEELTQAGWNKEDIEQAILGLDKLNLDNLESDYLKKWSWGGFGLVWIYFLANRAYKTAALYLLGMVVPILNIVIWIKAGRKGRQKAWTNGGWANFVEFKKRQKILDIIGIIVLIVSFPMVIVYGKKLINTVNQTYEVIKIRKEFNNSKELKTNKEIEELFNDFYTPTPQ